MKNWAFMLFVLRASLAGAQDAPDVPITKTVFKLAPFHFTQNTLKVGIENFNIDRSNSTSFYVGVRTNSNASEDVYNDNGYDGLLGEIQLKKYVSPIKAYTSKRNNTYKQGIYVGVFGQGGTYKGDHTYTEFNYDPITMTSTNINYKYSENVSNAALGFTLGVQRVLWDILFVDVYVGGGMQVAKTSTSGQIPPDNLFYNYHTPFDPTYKGIIPKIGIQIGIGL